MEWVRGWPYELHWARGHTGVRSRIVDSPAKLPAVVEWARRNPHIDKYSYRLTHTLQGSPINTCPAGHSLLTRKAGQPYRYEMSMQMLACRACPGHHRTTCPHCTRVVYDPPLEPGCGPAPPAG